MSLQIKSLTSGLPTKDIASAAPSTDSFNLIPSANDVYTLYSAAKETSDRKSAIVKGLRFVNTHDDDVTISLYFNRPNATGQFRRRLLAPANIVLTAGSSFIDDSEITLEPGDKIQAKASVANVIQYIISGVERDVV
jgi:hypothetical protein